MADSFYRQLGAGVASLTFGVALAVFIFAAATGIVASVSAWLLFAASFFLMLRFWFRYSELFVRFVPSHTFPQFLLDFAVSFFGILAVLAVGNIQIWALLGFLAMVASLMRCGLSRHETPAPQRRVLRTTGFGALFMAAVFAIIGILSSFVDSVTLAAAALVVVLVFVAAASRAKKKP